jgi:hypothetical protein
MVRSAPDDFTIRHTPQNANNESSPTARTNEGRIRILQLAKSVKTKDELSKLVDRIWRAPAEWTWLEYDGMQVGIGVVDRTVFSEPRLDVYGFVYNRHFKEWRRFNNANLRHAAKVKIELDKENAVLKLVDATNNDRNGKLILQWSLAYLSDDRAYVR